MPALLHHVETGDPAAPRARARVVVGHDRRDVGPPAAGTGRALPCHRRRSSGPRRLRDRRGGGLDRRPRHRRRHPARSPRRRPVLLGRRVPRRDGSACGSPATSRAASSAWPSCAPPPPSRRRRPGVTEPASCAPSGTAAVADAVVSRWFTPGSPPPGATSSTRHRAMLLATSAEGYADVAARPSPRWICGPTSSTSRRRRSSSPAPTIRRRLRPSPRRSPPDLPTAHVEVVGSAAHLANVEQPEAVTALLLDHLTSTRWGEARADRSDAGVVDAEPRPLAVLLAGEQAGPHELREVVADGRLRALQWLGEVAGAGLPTRSRGDHRDQPQAGRVRQRLAARRPARWPRPR